MDTKMEPLQARDIIIFLELYFKHDWRQILDCIAKKEQDFLDIEGNRIMVEIALFEILHNGYKVLTIIDEDYPQAIRSSIQPPFNIFYKGDEATIEKRYFDKYNTPGKYAERMYKGVFLD